MRQDMPRVADLVAQRRQELGAEHVNLCWRRGVLEQQPGWFYAREGAIAVGTPFVGSEVDTVPRELGAWDAQRLRPAALFRARQTAKGVTVQIKRSGGRKLIPHAWIGNGGKTVFWRGNQRTAKEQMPIFGVETIDVQQMFNTKKLNRAAVAKIVRDLPVELERAVRGALARRWK